MNYPAYRRRGWPTGSGETEAAAKQFDKRIKGTEQFWPADGVEPIPGLPAPRPSQDDRRSSYRENRPAYVDREARRLWRTPRARRGRDLFAIAGTG